MRLRFETTVPAIDQFWELFRTTNWNTEYQLTPEELTYAIRQNWYAVAAYDGEQLVGFGRVVSDGILHAMIYDLIVLPSYQGQGVGTQILEMLVQKCRQHKIRDIQLFCAVGKRGFYERRGFVARPNDAPGMDFGAETQQRS